MLIVGQYITAENLPTKAYEYMSMGIPVILSRTPFNEEMIQKYKFGICVDPENISEYVSAINHLLDHPIIAKELGENGRNAIRDRFNWTIEEKNLLKLYKEVIG